MAKIVLIGLIALIIMLNGCTNPATNTPSNNLPGLQLPDPTEEASAKITSLVAALGFPEKTMTIEFNNKHNSLDAKTIAISTGSLSTDNVCLDLSLKLGEQASSFKRQKSIIEYVGSQNSKNKLLVICDIGNEIDSSINSNGVKDAFPNCTGSSDSLQTMCFISIIPYK